MTTKCWIPRALGSYLHLNNTETEIGHIVSSWPNQDPLFHSCYYTKYFQLHPLQFPQHTLHPSQTEPFSISRSRCVLFPDFSVCLKLSP